MKKGTVITVSVRVKAKDKSKLPDWGLGKGVLSAQDVVLKEAVTKENKFRLDLKLEEVYQQQLQNTLEKIIEVKTKK